MAGSHQNFLPYMTNSLAIRQEIQRFESVHPSIYAIYDLIELVPDPLLAQQIREHVVCIEGEGEVYSRPTDVLQYLFTGRSEETGVTTGVTQGRVCCVTGCDGLQVVTH